MRIGIKKIKENDNQIAKKILEALAEALDDVLNNAAKRIKVRIRELIKIKIKESPEYQSLVNLDGVLRKELGVGDGEKVLNIVNIWLDSITVYKSRVRATNTKLLGGLQIVAINGGYGDVLTSAAATIQTNRGQILPWLEWLLLEGQKIIVKEYEVVPGIYPLNVSRTGRAIMKVSPKSWRVPTEYAGIQSNNWITRTIDKIDEDEILKIIQEEIERVM